MELTKTAKKFSKEVKEGDGFTLPEVTAVVAIAGTLAAIIVPVALDQIENGRIARAKQDIDTINQALSAFFRDTGEWPDRTDVNSPDGIHVLRSGGVNATFDLFDDNPTTGVKDPKVGDTNWATFADAGRVDSLVNHLTLDNPGGLTDIPNTNYRNADVNWNGPYMPPISNDPWGRNYLVFARAFTATEVNGSDVYVWIISGGPNETLETDVTSPILNNHTTGGTSTVGDDIGVMIFQARKALPGISSGGGSAILQ